jgi:hypothetical protein
MDQLQTRLEALEQQMHTVNRWLYWWRGLACGLAVLAVLTWALPAVVAQEEEAKGKGPKGLAQRVAALEELLKHFSREKNEIFITGANLHMVNGLGQTDCGTEEEPIPDCPNGLGNLIVGYNELREDPHQPNVRTGSHTVVVGSEHNFSSFGGLIVGRENEISGAFASISGGFLNQASGLSSSVSGGQANDASGAFASVSGGSLNTASGLRGSVSGGLFNQAPADNSSVSGGDNNTASGGRSSVSGGQFNTASGFASSVSGGSENTASGVVASVSGGGRDSFSPAGAGNIAAGDLSSVSGGSGNTASGAFSSVSGGQNRTAEGEFDWVAGSLLEDE